MGSNLRKIVLSVIAIILPIILVSVTLSMFRGGSQSVKAMAQQEPNHKAEFESDSDNLIEFVPDRIIVQYRSDIQFNRSRSGFLYSGSPSLDSLLSEQQVRESRSLFRGQKEHHFAGISQLSRVQILQLKPGSDVFETVRAFADDPEVEWAEPDYIARSASYNLGNLTATIPDDPLLGGQWGIDKIQAPDAWDVVTGTADVVIAVIDSGVDKTHPDLSAQLWVNPGEITGNSIDDDNNGYVDDVNGWDFVNEDNDPSDDRGHGTQVVGIAAAATNNAAGIAGVCWNCRVMSVKVMQISGVANYSDIAAGVLYAAQKGASIINLSLGGYGNSSALKTAIQTATNTYGTVIIGGAGNDNLNTPFYPAAYEDVLAVAGTTVTDTKAGLSNYGVWVDVSAPAINITTTFLGGDWGPVNGTSYAAPFASGIAGLLLSQHPDWDLDLVKSQFEHTSDPIDAENPGYVGMLGSGRLNAATAVSIAPHPILSLDSISVNGDPQGRPTQGESGTLEVTLNNDWSDATSVSGVLTTTDTFISFGQSSSSFGDISPGDTGTSTPAYTFTIDLAAGYNHPIPFTLDMTADGGAYTTTETFTVTTRSADEPVSGTIAENTTWTNDKTYILNNNLGIAPGVVLTIQPGTEVQFSGDYDFNVGGMLVADGTEAAPIRFRHQTGGSWGRIYFDDPSVDATTDISGTYQAGSILRWVQVEDAAEGIACGSATPYLDNLTLAGGGVNCTLGSTSLWIKDSSINGGLTVGGNAEVWGNTITGGAVNITGLSHVHNNNVSGGITTGSSSVVQDNIAGGTINAPGSSIVTNNFVLAGGISAGALSLVQDNQISGGTLSTGNSSTVMTNTVNNGGISVGDGSLVHFNNVEKGTGWGISSSGSVTITENRLVGGANGMNVSGGLVQGNLIANNSGIGLQINGNSTILSNTLTANSGSAIKLLSATSLQINDNNLEGNIGLYDIESSIPKTILMTVLGQYNWWGTTSNSAVAERIWDWNDDFNLGEVIYAPVLDGPVQTAPAYVRSVTLTPESPVGIETVTFDIDFSTDMDTANNPEVGFGEVESDYYIINNSEWLSPSYWQATYDINSLITRTTYIITVQNITGIDNVKIAPNSLYTFSVDYAGAIGDTTHPPKPQVTACAGSNLNTLSAQWSASDPDSSITLYQYAIGTDSGGADVVNWTNTTETSFTRNELNLLAGHTYYVSVKARNEGGLWSETSTPPGVTSGSDTCTSTSIYVSGYVKTNGGAGISNVIMNGLPGNLSTDSSGYYSATVAHGWSGTVTPQKDSYGFVPPSKTYSNVSSNQSDQNYIGTLDTYTVSGYVRTSGGTGISDVVMSGLPGDLTTDSSGFYSSSVAPGWSGTVTPQKSGYAFDPAHRQYSNVVSNQSNQDYVAIWSYIVYLPLILR